MRKIAANVVYSCIDKPIKFGHLVVDDDGTILDIVDTGGKLIEEEGLEYHNGVLVPGFIVNSVNADMTEKETEQWCMLGEEEEHFMNEAFNALKLTPRSYKKTLKVARTIADIAESRCIKTDHLAEALSYRMIDTVNN